MDEIEKLLIKSTAIFGITVGLIVSAIGLFLDDKQTVIYGLSTAFDSSLILYLIRKIKVK